MRFKLDIAGAGCDGQRMRLCIDRLKKANFKVEYKEEYLGRWSCYFYEAWIEVNSIEELISIRDTLDIDLIIEKNLNPNESGYKIFIYNDYIE